MNARPSLGHKLLHMNHSSNTNKHFFFHRIQRLWNFIPIIDLTLLVPTIKIKLAIFGTFLYSALMLTTTTRHTIYVLATNATLCHHLSTSLLCDYLDC